MEITYKKLPKIFYKKAKILVEPKELVVYNESLAKELDLSIPDKDKEVIATAYAGFQFGHLSNLGDGRAVLFEHLTKNNERIDVAIKGSGKTAYSRPNSDGKAAIGPMLREYIVSEAMHFLNIKTSRSLAVFLTGEDVYRQDKLKGSMLIRTCKSHIRVGTFNFAAYFAGKEDLRKLADYTIERHFPSANSYLDFFRLVCISQARLIASWQSIGFIHGVMNTDNMQIAGETIDYGPCAFLDVYNEEAVFSSIDVHGRYKYKNQPIIGAWNLARLAENLMPLINDKEEIAIELLQKELKTYWKTYNDEWLFLMRKKLGIEDGKEEDIHLVNEFLRLLKENKLDYTFSFMKLSMGEKLDVEGFSEWEEGYKKRKTIKPINPFVIPRNGYLEDVLMKCESGSFKEFNEFLEALRNPFKFHDKYSKIPPSSEGYRTFCGT